MAVPNWKIFVFGGAQGALGETINVGLPTAEMGCFEAGEVGGGAGKAGLEATWLQAAYRDSRPG